MAIYCAVHAPMPGSRFSFAIEASRLSEAWSRPGSSIMAAAREEIAAARGRISPIAVRSACARASGRGKTTLRPGTPAEAARRSPCCAANRPAKVEAAATLICCPRMARIELEGVPSPGDAQARPCRNQRRELGVAREMAVDRRHIGVEIEEPPQPSDNGGQ